MNVSILPFVKSHHLRNNKTRIPEVIEFACPDTCQRLNQYLSTCRENGFGFKQATGLKQPFLHFIITKSLKHDIEETAKHEMYKLTLAPLGIILEACHERGFFYGVNTLRQLLRQCKDGLLNCGEITDWPDLPTRAMHITLGNGNMPTYEQFKAIIPMLAFYKYNTLILEYDDRFPWCQHPLISHQAAFTKEQLIELIKLAEDHFLEVIPLVDSLGHAKQYLKHQEYSHLKEVPDQIAEMCPSNPATLTFIKELWDEVLELHPHSRYAHISGDEVFRLGAFCPACQPYSDSGTLAKLYLNYFTELSRWIISKGKTPVLWGDMLVKYPHCLDQFPHDIIINDWCYIGQEKTHLAACYDIYDPTGLCDEKRQHLFHQYWHDTGHQGFKQFPYFQFFKDHGFEVMAATAASGELVPSLLERFENNKQFARSAKKAAGSGLVNTFWSTNGPFEAAWFGVVAGAAFSWTAGDESISQFAASFCVSFLRLPPNYSDILLGFDAGNQVELPVATDAPLVVNYQKMLNVGSQLKLFDQQLLAITIRLHQAANGNGKTKIIDMAAGANTHLHNSMPAQAPAFDFRDGAFAIPADEDIIPGSKDAGVIRLKSGCRITISVKDLFDQLTFHTMCHSLTDGAIVARMQVTYNDGVKSFLSFKGGDNVADWWGRPNLRLNSRLTWHGQTYCGQPICAYAVTWTNPYPQKSINKIEFIGDDTHAQMVVLAIEGANDLHYTTHPATYLELKAEIAVLENKQEKIVMELAHTYDSMIVPEDKSPALQQIVQKRKQAFKYCHKLIDQKIALLRQTLTF